MKIAEIRERIAEIEKCSNPNNQDYATLDLLKDFIRGISKGFVNGMAVKVQAKEIVKLIGEK